MSYSRDKLRSMTEGELLREQERIALYRLRGVATYDDEGRDRDIARELARREFEKQNPTEFEKKFGGALR
jgi:hypothetical protein